MIQVTRTQAAAWLLAAVFAGEALCWWLSPPPRSPAALCEAAGWNAERNRPCRKHRGCNGS
jgi:hypothetical protein